MRKCIKCNLSSLPYNNKNNYEFKCEHCGCEEYVKPFW